ncbi:MAG: branched-chain amino acid ABC transporter permease [Armatimonadetes bacterium]|nr:branched-chain amino acid ABC transporter permease [Armatimonadota bacterium]
MASSGRFWLIRLISCLLGIALCFGIQSVAHMLGNTYYERLIILAGLYVTLAVSLNLINGITGQFSIGHAAFYQVGAYAAGFISVHYMTQLHMGGYAWMFLMVVVGGIAAAITGFTVGLPSLRLRGDYLAIVTLGFGEIIRIIVQNSDALGGSYGMKDIPKDYAIWAVWLLAATCIATCRNLLRSAHGLSFLAVREDEVAALAMGVNITRVKVTAFVIGSMFAGAAGALLAMFEGFVSPPMFSMDTSFIILTMVVLGGTGSITGSVIAACFLSYLPEYLRTLQDANHQALMISGASIVAGILSALGSAALLKRMLEHASNLKGRLIATGSSIAVLIVAKLALTPLLTLVKPMAEKQIPAEQLRMVIFALTLIVIMLIRPSGILGRSEFSLDWLKRVFMPNRRMATEL